MPVGHKKLGRSLMISFLKKVSVSTQFGYMSMRILDLSGPVCPMCLYIRQSVGMSCNYDLIHHRFYFLCSL